MVCADGTGGNIAESRALEREVLKALAALTCAKNSVLRVSRFVVVGERASVRRPASNWGNTRGSSSGRHHQ
jgi:hypothetical protein